MDPKITPLKRNTFTSFQKEHEPLHATLHQEMYTPSEEFDTEGLLCLEGPLSDEDETLEKPSLTEKPKKTSGNTKGVKKSSKGFRLYGKNFILTYPQCNRKKEEAAQQIETNFREELKGYVVCEENHQDGTPHLHVFLSFETRTQFKKSNCFDFIGGKHGNYKVANSVRGSVAYVTKAGNYLAKGLDVESIKGKKAQKNTEIAKMLMDGKNLAEINEHEPGYVMINKKKLEEYGTWVRTLKARKEKIEYQPPTLDGLNTEDLQIAKWITDNIRSSRQFKQQQLFISGERNRGKTSLIEFLERSLSVYHIPHTEDFYDAYDDEYDLAVLDEFKGQKTLQWMNEFLQGSRMTLRKKGSQHLKVKNMPVIILSNYSLGECYPKAAMDGRLTTLEARLLCVSVEKFINVYGLANKDLI